MYCKHCGEKLTDGVAICPACNNAVIETAVAVQAVPVWEPARQRDAASFEYTRTAVANHLVTVATDSYESLGWELTSTQRNVGQPTTELAFRRSRKLVGKAQLLKIQHRVDDLLKTVADLEGAKGRKATMAALMLGIPAALVMGAGMSLCMVAGGNLMIPGILVGILGMAGVVAAWPLYRSTLAKEQAAAAPQIEAAYDNLATACEEAQALLRGSVA